MTEQQQIRFDEQTVRDGLANRIGRLNLDNEILASAISVFQSENAALVAKVRDLESEIAMQSAAELTEIKPLEMVHTDGG